MITATAPGRCGLVGNPTDMYGGSVLSCSTRERARCCAGHGLRRHHHHRLRPEPGHRDGGRPRPAGGDFLNVARAVLAALEVTPGRTPPFHLTAETDIPMQAGLAGSTAILATITGCLLTHLELRLNPYEIAELIRKIEYDLLGIVCGFQDHYMTVFGGLNFMDFRDKNSALPQEPTTPYATVEPLDRFVSDLPLVLAHTGVRHHSGTVHKSIRERWLEGEPAVVEGYLEIARLARAAQARPARPRLGRPGRPDEPQPCRPARPRRQRRVQRAADRRRPGRRRGRRETGRRRRRRHHPRPHPRAGAHHPGLDGRRRGHNPAPAPQPRPDRRRGSDGVKTCRRAGGRRMIVTSRAPVRRDFAGGWTDVDVFARGAVGGVLNATINHYVTGRLETAESAGDALRPQGHGALEGLSVAYGCDLPTGSGLGTSSALNVVWLSLIKSRVTSLEERHTIAETAYTLETILGMLGGKQDQYAAAFGGFNFMTFGDTVKVETLSGSPGDRARPGSPAGPLLHRQATPVGQHP